MTGEEPRQTLRFTYLSIARKMIGHVLLSDTLGCTMRKQKTFQVHAFLNMSDHRMNGIFLVIRIPSLP